MSSIGAGGNSRPHRGASAMRCNGCPKRFSTAGQENRSERQESTSNWPGIVIDSYKGIDRLDAIDRFSDERLIAGSGCVRRSLLRSRSALAMRAELLIRLRARERVTRPRRRGVFTDQPRMSSLMAGKWKDYKCRYATHTRRTRGFRESLSMIRRTPTIGFQGGRGEPAISLNGFESASRCASFRDRRRSGQPVNNGFTRAAPSTATIAVHCGYVDELWLVER